jgi:hypothetical protein
MNTKVKILLIIIIVLLISNFYVFLQYLLVRGEVIQLRNAVTAQKINAKTLVFTKLFIKKVLKAEGEIDYETRFRLESAVRDLNDEAILSQWQKFVDSKTEGDAQTAVKNLLDTLADKIAAR